MAYGLRPEFLLRMIFTLNTPTIPYFKDVELNRELISLSVILDCHRFIFIFIYQMCLVIHPHICTAKFSSGVLKGRE